MQPIIVDVAPLLIPTSFRAEWLNLLKYCYLLPAILSYLPTQAVSPVYACQRTFKQFICILRFSALFPPDNGWQMLQHTFYL